MDNNVIVSKLTTEEGGYLLYAGGEFVNKMPESDPRYQKMVDEWIGLAHGGKSVNEDLRLYATGHSQIVKSNSENLTFDGLGNNRNFCGKLKITKRLTLFNVWVNDDSVLGAIFDMVREAAKGIFAILERKEVK